MTTDPQLDDCTIDDGATVGYSYSEESTPSAIGTDTIFTSEGTGLLVGWTRAWPKSTNDK